MATTAQNRRCSIPGCGGWAEHGADKCYPHRYHAARARADAGIGASAVDAFDPEPLALSPDRTVFDLATTDQSRQERVAMWNAGVHDPAVARRLWDSGIGGSTVRSYTSVGIDQPDAIIGHHGLQITPTLAKFLADNGFRTPAEQQSMVGTAARARAMAHFVHLGQTDYQRVSRFVDRGISPDMVGFARDAGFRYDHLLRFVDAGGDLDDLIGYARSDRKVRPEQAIRLRESGVGYRDFDWFRRWGIRSTRKMASLRREGLTHDTMAAYASARTDGIFDSEWRVWKSPRALTTGEMIVAWRGGVTPSDIRDYRRSKVVSGRAMVRLKQAGIGPGDTGFFVDAGVKRARTMVAVKEAGMPPVLLVDYRMAGVKPAQALRLWKRGIGPGERRGRRRTDL